MISSDAGTNSPIFSMCKTGDLHGVINLLTNNATKHLLHAKDFHGNSLLYYACLCGRIALVKYLSELGLRDDEFRRCYWNALSLQTRSVLKLFNDYKSISSSNTESVRETSVLEVMQKYLMKCLHNSSTNDDSGHMTESKSGEDMVLRFKFKDQSQPSEFKCHSWIILSRWPQIVLFAMNKVKIEESLEIFLTPMVKQEMNLCKMSTQEFENYVKSSNKDVAPHKLNKIIKQEKVMLKQLKPKFNCILKIPNLDACNQAISPEELESTREKIKCIDFGSINSRREYFDLAMTYLYTAKLPGSLEKHDLQCLLELATLLNMKNLVDYVFNLLREVEDKFQESLLLDELDPSNYLFKSSDKISKINYLKLSSCNMGLKTANSNNILKCHKNIALSRCEFFDVLVNCDFEDGLKFKNQEATHQLPVLELQQFSLDSILQQLLIYIYCEKVEITNLNAIELMSISELYGLSSLADKCEQYLCDNTTSKFGDLFELYKLSIEVQRKKWQKSLEPKTLEFILEQSRRGKVKQSDIIKELEQLDVNPDTIQRFKNATKLSC